jgi:hypothetical protein
LDANRGPDSAPIDTDIGDYPGRRSDAYDRNTAGQALVVRHRRFACRCAHCGAGIKAPAPAVATATPFGPRIHALAIYLKGFQALSYERLRFL